MRRASHHTYCPRSPAVQCTGSMQPARQRRPARNVRNVRSGRTPVLPPRKTGPLDRPQHRAASPQVSRIELACNRCYYGLLHEPANNARNCAAHVGHSQDKGSQPLLRWPQYLPVAEMAMSPHPAPPTEMVAQDAKSYIIQSTKTAIERCDSAWLQLKSFKTNIHKVHTKFHVYSKIRHYRISCKDNR